MIILIKILLKILSLKLFEWTNQRWIITFSKTKGEISIKEKEENKKLNLLIKPKTLTYIKHVLKKFSDANLIDVISKKQEKE